MNIRIMFAGPFSRFLCVVLAIVTATAPSAAVIAQTNAAAQAVRGRVEGLGGRPDETSSPRALGRAPGDTTLLADPTAGKIDTTYVTPQAIAVIVLRPAQIMAAPMAEMLPTEVASAAGLKYFGFDPADVDEIIAFVDPINPLGLPAYGLTIKFNKPFRGSAIPQATRGHARLSELAGKKYLQSSQPMLPSFYGPNNKTLIIAPDATLRQLVESLDQPKTSPLLDRAAAVPAGNDLYAAVDVASLRPLIQLSLAGFQAQAPPETKPFLDAPNLVAAVELMLNISAPAPMSLVVHGNDEAAAQQLETLMLAASKTYRPAAESERAPSDDPIEQALAQYMERISQPFQPQRNGASLTCFYIDGQNQAQQQLMSVAVIGGAVAMLLPAIQAARKAARRAESSEPPETFETSEAAEIINEQDSAVPPAEQER